MIGLLAGLLFWVDDTFSRCPVAGTILDTILGPAEDFEFVSKTTPVEREQ